MASLAVLLARPAAAAAPARCARGFADKMLELPKRHARLLRELEIARNPPPPKQRAIGRLEVSPSPLAMGLALSEGSVFDFSKTTEPATLGTPTQFFLSQRAKLRHQRSVAQAAAEGAEPPAEPGPGPSVRTSTRRKLPDLRGATYPRHPEQIEQVRSYAVETEGRRESRHRTVIASLFDC